MCIYQDGWCLSEVRCSPCDFTSIIQPRNQKILQTLTLLSHVIFNTVIFRLVPLRRQFGMAACTARSKPVGRFCTGKYNSKTAARRDLDIRQCQAANATILRDSIIQSNQGTGLAKAYLSFSHTPYVHLASSEILISSYPGT